MNHKRQCQCCIESRSSRNYLKRCQYKTTLFPNPLGKFLCGVHKNCHKFEPCPNDLIDVHEHVTEDIIQFPGNAVPDNAIPDNVVQGNAVPGNVVEDNVVPGNAVEDDVVEDDVVEGNAVEDDVVEDDVDNQEIVIQEIIGDDEVDEESTDKDGSKPVQSNIDDIDRKYGDLRDDCINVDLLTGDTLDSVDPNNILKIPPGVGEKGYCYDFDFFMKDIRSRKSNVNPYTNRPLFNNVEQLNDILKHEKFDDAFREFARIALYPSEIDKSIADAIIDNLDQFNAIGIAGYICADDYTDDFPEALLAINKLSTVLTSEVLLNLKVPTHVIDPQKMENQPTVQSIIASAHGSCIHGVGNDLIKIYLYYWFEFNKSMTVSEQIILVPIFTQLQFSRAICYPVSNFTGIVLYIHPDLYSKYKSLTYLYLFNKIRMTIRPDGRTIDFVIMENKDDYAKAHHRLGFNVFDEIPFDRTESYPDYEPWSLIYLGMKPLRDNEDHHPNLQVIRDVYISMVPDIKKNFLS